MRECFPDEDVEVCQISGKVEVTISQMFEYIEVSFSKLKEISDEFGCKEIDLKRDKTRGGCESCDWGSRYEVTFICYDFKD